MTLSNQITYTLDTKMRDCNFTDSTLSELFYKDVVNISQLILFLRKRLDDFPFVSKKCLQEVERFLEDNNLEFVEKSEFEILNTHIKECGFSRRIQGVFEFEKINYVKDLILLSENQLLNLPNLGRKSVRVIIEFLRTNNLSLTRNVIAILKKDTKFGMRLLLKTDDEISKQIIELWLKLKTPLLHEEDCDLLRAKYFLENINLLESSKQESS